MKRQLKQLLVETVNELCRLGQLQPGAEKRVHIERTRDVQHGDFASNLAMALAKQEKRNPRELAQQIIAAMPVSELVEKAEEFITAYDS